MQNMKSAYILLALCIIASAIAKDTTSGDFGVTVNGVFYNPASNKETKLKDITVTSAILVRGVHVEFDLSPATFGVYNYTLTGAADAERMVVERTIIFTSKVPTLTAAQTANAKIDELRLKDSDITIILKTSAGKLKIQAKDAAQGGIFQQEPEFGSNIELTHVLGPQLFYFVNPYTGKINFGDGIDAVTSPAEAAHEMLLGKDSPQVANKTLQTATTTKWTVASGGRLGGVLGEDAIELSQGATSCTHQCQAQNRIQGSATVPPNPVTPQPL